MQTALLIALALLALAVLVLQVLLWRKPAAPTVDLAPLVAKVEAIQQAQERTDRLLREEIGRNREEAARDASGLRQEVQGSLAAVGGGIRDEIGVMASAQKTQLETLAAQLGAIRTELSDAVSRLTETTEKKLEALQNDNAQKLEQIRRTVDEQLQTTLEKRLGESFQLVSERLEQVHRGLGEMQTLAAGVGDLKKLLSNVRARGTWGEVQLGMLLEQLLTADQYATNVATTGTAERVEFAIKLPGGEGDAPVWLPIDAKFPKEDYERLLDAVERADAAAIEESSRQIELRVRQCAKDISQKYIEPPKTTDFAIMYLPTEGLYAEVLRRGGLIEALQREHRVTVSGPTTLAAILNSLQMGFRTLAIQKRSSEVWEVLGTVKTQFGKYAAILERIQKKLAEADKVVEEGLTRTRVIQRNLKNVQEMPALAAEIAIPLDAGEPALEAGADEGE
jgi:DNA recombination protein RmuC